MEIKFESRFLERSLVFSTITSFVLAAFSIISDILIFSKKVYSFDYFSFFAVLIISIIFFTVYQNYFSIKTKGASQIRFFIFFCIFLGVFCFFLNDFLNPVFLFIFSFVILIYYGILYEPLYYHDIFENNCEGKSGEKLGVDLYKDKFLGEDLLKSLNNTKVMQISFTLFMLLFLCALNFTTYVFSIKTYIFSFIYLVCSFFLILLFKIYLDEIYYAFMGFEKQWGHRQKILKTAFITFNTILIFGFIFSSNKSICKIKRFNLDFDYIRPEKIEPQTFSSDIPVSPQMPEVTFDGLPEVQPNKNLEIILFIIEIILALFVVFLILTFLFKPFVSGDFLDYLRQKRLKDYFKEFAYNFREMLRNLFKRKKHDLYATTDSKLFQNNMDFFLKRTKKSKEKKAELDRLTKMFMKLIDWGTQYYIIYKKNLAPLEYTNELSSFLIKKNWDENLDKLNTAGNLFEKALYSEELLSQKEEEAFNSSVLEIIKMEIK